MTRTISEADWKILRQLHPLALERFSQRTLDEVARLTAATSETAHARYLAVYKLLQRRDRELADAFNDLRRSTAFSRLAHILAHGLFTDEEIARFSPEARAVVEFLAGKGGD